VGAAYSSARIEAATERSNHQWAEMKNDDFAAREAEQERGVYEAKMLRDARLDDEYHAARTAVPSSEPQRTYIANRRAERGLDALPFTGTKQQASAEIERLLAIPRPAQPVTPKVPDGKYAVVHNGELKFYVVNTPIAGKWAGRTFVDVYASDETHPVRGATAAAVLELIAADPLAASSAYGRETRRCGVCNRKLTKKSSRDAGIGPVCAERF
jgi:hypothetical protein